MQQFSLSKILSSIADKNGNKRIIYDGSDLGGPSALVIWSIIISSPFIGYGLLFNSIVFNKLSIATAIIGYIVYLSTAMLLIAFLVWWANRKVVKAIEPSWKEYFLDVDLNMVISSTKTPYSDFFRYFKLYDGRQDNETKLHDYLIESFKKMKQENNDLIEAMNRNKK